MNSTHTHLDCRNYAPVDVAKGICHVKKQMVAGDDAVCENFQKLPKCKFCIKFKPGKEKYLGTCIAQSNPVMTYPDLAGVTCEWFSWKEN